MQHIETIELGSSQSSITFSSIPQDYDDLVVLASTRTSNANDNTNIVIKPNGSAANRSDVELIGTGSIAESSSGTDGLILRTAGADATANTFGSGQIYISNYTSSSAKSISAESVNEDNATQALQSIAAMLWNDTSAITSLEFIELSAGNFVAGTVMSLYGVTAGGDGTVTTS